MPKGQTTTKKCTECDKDVSLFAFNRHLKSHFKDRKDHKDRKKLEVFTQGACQFCDKVYYSKIGFSNHIRRCPKNPNRKMEVLTDAGRKSISENNKSRTWTEEQRAAHSVSMKLAVSKNPESYTSANRGRCKQIIVDDIKFIGQWEVDFYRWAKKEGLNPVRVTTGFNYNWNGDRTYYPDFYIKSLDLYIEVKGYETDRDRAKWLLFPEKLCIIKRAEIEKIRNNTFRACNLKAKYRTHNSRYPGSTPGGPTKLENQYENF